MSNPNKLRLPPRKSLQFQQGWRACEAGARRLNPYHTEGGAYARDWSAGFDARAEIGFETAHLPRKVCSDAFAI